MRGIGAAPVLCDLEQATVAEVASAIAKAEADRAVQESDREWTIVRPGRLTDDPGKGRVRIDAEPYRGEVSRDDVAAVLARLVHDQRFARRLLYVNGGEEPIEQALENLVSHQACHRARKSPC